MIEKVKKVYESPSMTVYEMGRPQILAGSDPATTREGYLVDDEFRWE